MPSDFTQRCQPSQVLFTTTTADGDVVSLRVPGIDDPVACGLEDEAHEAFAAAGGAFADQLPTWWVEYASCTQDMGCGCGAADLAAIVCLLAADQRAAAVRAHLDLTQSLRGHLTALFDLAHGEVGEVCTSCLTDPEEHMADLDNVVDYFARDLIETLSVTGMSLQVMHDPGGR